MSLKGTFSHPITAHTAAERRVLTVSAIIAALLLLADQASKLLIESAWQLHESTPVIPGILSITSVRNHGAAWSILSGHGWLLLLISLSVLAAGIFFFRSLTEGWRERYYAVFMVFSGIIGNSIDRLWRGAVVDFIDVHYYSSWSYPVFNIADIAICTGMGIFMLSNLLRPERKNSDAKAGTEKNDDVECKRQ